MLTAFGNRSGKEITTIDATRPILPSSSLDTHSRVFPKGHLEGSLRPSDQNPG